MSAVADRFMRAPVADVCGRDHRADEIRDRVEVLWDQLLTDRRERGELPRSLNRVGCAAAVVAGGGFVTSVDAAISTTTTARWMLAALYIAGVPLSGGCPCFVDLRAAFPLRLSPSVGADDPCFAVERVQGVQVVTDRVSEPRTTAGAAPSPADVREQFRGWSRAAQTTLDAPLAVLWDPNRRRDDALTILVRRLA